MKLLILGKAMRMKTKAAWSAFLLVICFAIVARELKVAYGSSDASETNPGLGCCPLEDQDSQATRRSSQKSVPDVSPDHTAQTGQEPPRNP
jgi:hypothetical protein